MSLKYKFPDDTDGQKLPDIKEKIELSDNDEILINSNWAVRKIKAKYFRGSQWEKWEEGEKGKDWINWKDWTNWISIEKITSEKVWKTTTVTIWKSDGTEKKITIEDWKDWNWTWDMLKSENLAWLENRVEARKNLKVYSKDEVDSKKTDSDDKINLINRSLLNKVDKIVWYWLSRNDFTDEALAKLNSINPDLFAKLDSENIFKADQTIKKEWVNLYFNSSSHSSLRYQKDGVDLFALSVWGEKNFKISRFVNGNWVWDAMTINNADWKIWIHGINNSANSFQVMWMWMNVTWLDPSKKIEIRDNRILPWWGSYNAELWWWAFTWDTEIFWIWTSKKMALTASSIKLLNIKKEPDIYGLSSWDIYLKKFRDDYYYLSLIP